MPLAQPIKALAPATPSLSPLLTLADAERSLAAWTDLAPARARKMRTALATAARLLAPGQSRTAAAAAVPVHCSSLSRLLQAQPATFGLSHGRMQSLCSELRYILRRLGLHEPSRRGTALSAELQACVDQLPEYRRLAMLDFMRFLDVEGIDVARVDSDVLDIYRERCAGRTLCVDPDGRTQQIAAAWNWGHKHVPSWPGQAFARQSRANRYSVPLDSYPASFQQDLEGYLRRLSGSDATDIFTRGIFDKREDRAAPAWRPLRPTSISGKRWVIRCAAAALVHKGVDREQLRELRDLVYPLDHPEFIIRFFLERRGGKTSPMAARVAQTLYLLARDHCRMPDDHVAEMIGWSKNCRPQEPIGLTEKNARRLRKLMQPRVRAMLLCFPLELMRRSGEPGLKPDVAARLAMYAVAMELLLICPMRRGNLAALRLDLHLHQPDPRKQVFTHILIGADEVKNAQPIHWPIPAESQKLVTTYLRRHRHHLVEPGNPYLFGSGDKQRAAQFLGEWLARCVTGAVGAEFNVHLARHFAAWNFLRLNPGQYEVMRQVLGHRSIDTTIRYYVGLEADASARHFDATVLADRQGMRKIAAHAFRKGSGGLSMGGRRSG